MSCCGERGNNVKLLRERIAGCGRAWTGLIIIDLLEVDDDEEEATFTSLIIREGRCASVIALLSSEAACIVQWRFLGNDLMPYPA